ncbi:MAG: DUF1833 family protein, partial [Pseudomonadota bacterium]
MSRTVSSPTRQALYAAETGEAFLILLTLNHASLSAPIRVTSDGVETTSRGNVFAAFPFELVLPDDQDNVSPRARLVIDNIDRQIVQAVRTISSASLMRYKSIGFLSQLIAPRFPSQNILLAWPWQGSGFFPESALL